MKKLSLKLDELNVASFETIKNKNSKTGTVVGNTDPNQTETGAPCDTQFKDTLRQCLTAFDCTLAGQYTC
ncbi:MAG: hypothetical protein ACEPO8_08490 [Rhodothermaceae bacterium]